MSGINRREMLKLAAGAAGVGFSPVAMDSKDVSGPGSAPHTAEGPNFQEGRSRGGRRYWRIVLRYELMMRGHNVVLLEASGHTGGHVKTCTIHSRTICMPTSAPSTLPSLAMISTGATYVSGPDADLLSAPRTRNSLHQGTALYR